MFSILWVLKRYLSDEWIWKCFKCQSPRIQWNQLALGLKANLPFSQPYCSSLRGSSILVSWSHWPAFLWFWALLWIPGWRSAYLWGDDPTSHTVPHSHVACWPVSSCLAPPNTLKFSPWISILLNPSTSLLFCLDWSLRGEPTPRSSFQIS